MVNKGVDNLQKHNSKDLTSRYYAMEANPCPDTHKISYFRVTINQLTLNLLIRNLRDLTHYLYLINHCTISTVNNVFEITNTQKKKIWLFIWDWIFGLKYKWITFRTNPWKISLSGSSKSSRSNVSGKVMEWYGAVDSSGGKSTAVERKACFIFSKASLQSSKR